MPTGFSFTKDNTAGTFTLSGTPTEAGDYEFLVRSSGSNDGQTVTDTIRLHVTNTTGIVNVNGNVNGNANAIYDLQGRRLTGKPATGLYIQGGKVFNVK